MLSRTPLGVMLYVHRLSCLKVFRDAEFGVACDGVILSEEYSETVLRRFGLFEVYMDVFGSYLFLSSRKGDVIFTNT